MNYLAEAVREMVSNAFCRTGRGGGVDPHCSPGEATPGRGGKSSNHGGDNTAATHTTKAADLSQKANRKAPSERAALFSQKAHEAAEAGDHAAAAKAHSSAKAAHAGALKTLAAGDRQKNGFFAHADAANAHEAAAEAHKKAGDVAPKKTPGGVEHVPPGDRAISHTAHDGAVPVNPAQAIKQLKEAGLEKLYRHQFAGGSSIGERGNGHAGDNSVAIDKPTKYVRDRLEQAGWVKTHVHNLPSAAGGGNHQEAFRKGKHVLTTVDYGYGTTTIRISKK